MVANYDDLLTTNWAQLFEGLDIARLSVVYFPFKIT